MVDPPYTYLGIAGHLLSDINILAKASPPSGIGLPMLCAHALECMLKAYLSRQGDDKSVRTGKIRHDLGRLWTRASDEGLPITREPPNWVKQLSGIHDSPYYLRYSTNVNGIVSPAPIIMTAGLADLLELVRRQISQGG